MTSLMLLVGLGVLVLVLLGGLIGGIVFLVVRAQDKQPPRD